MARFSIFVDGSNLYGTLKHMGVKVDDYEAFFRFLFTEGASCWRETFDGGAPSAQLRRVYWYVVGSMDEWDLANPKTQSHLRERFDNEREVKRGYMAQAGQKMPGEPQDKVATEAWSLCFNDFKAWYERKQKLLDGMCRFHHAVRASTDWIDIVESGRWKADHIHMTLEEKGIDTSLAVDMVTLADNYDVGLVVSGDADFIPSIQYAKTRNKAIGVVEFHKGYPPDKRGKGFSSYLKLAADFVVHIYEADLVSKKIGSKGSIEEATGGS